MIQMSSKNSGIYTAVLKKKGCYFYAASFLSDMFTIKEKQK